MKLLINFQERSWPSSFQQELRFEMSHSICFVFVLVILSFRRWMVVDLVAVEWVIVVAFFGSSSVDHAFYSNLDWHWNQAWFLNFLVWRHIHWTCHLQLQAQFMAYQLEELVVYPRLKNLEEELVHLNFHIHEIGFQKQKG